MCTDRYHVKIESGDIISLSFNNSVYIGMVASVFAGIAFSNDISVVLLGDKRYTFHRNSESIYKACQENWMLLQYCCEKGRVDSRIAKLKSRTFKRSVRTIQNNFIQRFMHSASQDIAIC